MMRAEELLSGDNVESNCDFTFGDVAGTFHNVPHCHFKRLKPNAEFDRVLRQKEDGSIVNVFIDTVRLCHRVETFTDDYWRNWNDRMMKDGTVLEFLSKYKSHKFRIFCSLDDRHVPPGIHLQIPDNVIEIKSINVELPGLKVKPMPYGLSRVLHSGEDRRQVMLEMMELARNTEPENKLYANFSPHTNPVRSVWADHLRDKHWAVHRQGLNFRDYLMDIVKYKFILCPPGKAVDCHRNWEVVSLGRIPVFVNTPYCTDLYKSFRPLNVDHVEYLSEDLLEAYNRKNSDFRSEIKTCHQYMYGHEF